MKKLIFLLAGIALTTAAMAQAPEKKQEIKKEEMKDLHKDVVEKRHDRKEIGKAAAHGRVKKAIVKRKEVRADKRDINYDAKRLERHGVKHPVVKVKHKIRSEKEAKKARY
jgi:hypothetical protein